MRDLGEGGDSRRERVRGWVHVSVPYRRLVTEFWDLVTHRGVNLELGLDHEALEGFSLEHFRETARVLAGRGVSVSLHAPFLDLSPGALDPQILAATRHRFSQVARVAEIFDPLCVVCHTGWDRKRYGFVQEPWLDAAAETFRWFSEELGNASRARALIENVYEKRPGILMELFERLPVGAAGFCLDVGHALAFSGTPLSGWLDALGDRMEEVHVHDNHGAQDEHLAAGAGEVDFPLLLEFVHQMPRMPLFTLEAHSPEGVAQSLDFFASRLKRPPHAREERKDRP
ncbi:MAG: sugar phosphate isomerase/epimerase [Pseudomonadota bacterium]